MTTCELQVGQAVRHTVGDTTRDLRITRITDEFVFFHDGTHCTRRDDMSWLVPILPKANEGSWDDACAGCGYLPQHCECD